jgi:hypothetical protein
VSIEIFAGCYQDCYQASRQLQCVPNARETGLQNCSRSNPEPATPPQFIGADKEWGTLDPGRRADLLVIDGRPDQSIQDTRNIVAVIQRGQTLDRTS